MRDPLSAVKIRVGLGAGRLAAQAVAGVAVAFAVVFAIPGAVLWYLETDSARAALLAVAATFFALALIALLAMLIIAARQRRVRREASIAGAVMAALAARPAAVMHGGSRVLRLVGRAPLLAVGGALVAGALLAIMGPGNRDDAEGTDT